MPCKKGEGEGIRTCTCVCRFSLLLRIGHWQWDLLLVFVSQEIVKPRDSGMAIQKEHTIWSPTFHHAHFEASLGGIAAHMLTFSHFTTFSCYPYKNPGTPLASSLQQVYKDYFHLADEGFPWTPGINYKNPENLLGPMAQVNCTFEHGSSSSWHHLHCQSPSPLGICTLEPRNLAVDAKSQLRQSQLQSLSLTRWLDWPSGVILDTFADTNVWWLAK